MNHIPNEEYWRRVYAERQQDDPSRGDGWRAFEPIGTRDQLEAVQDLIAVKNLSKTDITLLLVTLRLFPSQNISMLLPPAFCPAEIE